MAIAPTGIIRPKASFLPKVIFYSLQGEKGIRKLMKIMFSGDTVPEEVVQFQLLVNSHFKLRTDSPALFSDEELKSLACPLTYICGKDDFVFDGDKAVKRLKAVLPGAETRLPEKGYALTDLDLLL